MTPPTCACGNEARYLNVRGELTCALCPLREGVASWRLTDIPAKLATPVATRLVDHPLGRPCSTCGAMADTYCVYVAGHPRTYWQPMVTTVHVHRARILDAG